MNNANTGVNCVCKSQKSHVTRCRDHKGAKFCNIFFFLTRNTTPPFAEQQLPNVSQFWQVIKEMAQA